MYWCCDGEKKDKIILPYFSFLYLTEYLSNQTYQTSLVQLLLGKFELVIQDSYSVCLKATPSSMILEIVFLLSFPENAKQSRR